MIASGLHPFASVTLTLDELIVLGDWAIKQKDRDDTILLQISRNTGGIAEVHGDNGTVHQLTPLAKKRFGA